MTRARSTSSCATCRTQRSTATSASRATSTSPQRYVLHYSTHCERELTHPPADLHRVSIASALRWVPTAHTMPRAHSTNVTLVTGSNYQVLFVDPANTTIVYATSGTFSVEAPGSKSFLHNGSLNSGGDASWSPDSHHIRVSPTSCNLVIVPRCEYGPWQLSGMPCPHLFLVSWLLPRQDESKRIGETFRAWHRTCPPVVWGSIEPSLAPLFMDSVPYLARSHPFSLLASPAPSVSPSGSASASGSAASGSGASHSGSSSASGSGASASTTQNAAAPALGVSAGGVMGVIAACGVASLSALLL